MQTPDKLSSSVGSFIYNICPPLSQLQGDLETLSSGESEKENIPPFDLSWFDSYGNGTSLGPRIPSLWNLADWGSSEPSAELNTRAIGLDHRVVRQASILSKSNYI